MKCMKSMKSPETMKIDETETSWDRVKVSLRASFRWQRAAEAANPGPLKSTENLRNHMESVKYNKIYENV